MEVEELKRIITLQREGYEKTLGSGDMIKRDINFPVIEKSISHPNALAILGVRRCGKSILALLLFSGKNFGYINFFDDRLSEFKKEDFDKLLQAFYELYSKTEYLILDEIQTVPLWERFVSRIRDTRHVIVTGSSSKLLYGELATFLTGRHIDIELFPFGFHEYLALKKTKLPPNWHHYPDKIAEIKANLSEYLHVGGFPEVEKSGISMLQTIYYDIVEKDVIDRHSLRKPQKMKELARYFVSNSGGEVSFNKLKNIVGIKDTHTAIKYSSYLEEAYLIFFVTKFSYKLKERMLASKKAYTIDTGLANSFYVGGGENTGKLMENLVAIELSRRIKYSFGRGNVHYWKDAAHREVDFAIVEGSNVQQLIQVTYASSQKEIKERETKSLRVASDALRCNDLLVITWDYEAESDGMGGKKIKFIPLWKWLLEGKQRAE